MCDDKFSLSQGVAPCKSYPRKTYPKRSLNGARSSEDTVKILKRRMISEKFISLIIISITFYEFQLIVRDWIELLSCKQDRQFDNFVVIACAISTVISDDKDIFPAYGQLFPTKYIIM